MDESALTIHTLLWSLFAGIASYWCFVILRSLYQRYAIRRSIKKHWPSRPYHWFWGHAALVKDLRDHPEKMVDLSIALSKDFTYGSGVFLGPLITLLRVAHRKVFRTILGSSSARFPKSDAQYRSLHPWLGSKGLLLLGGREWRRHRHLLSNSFHFDILRPYVAKMNECSSVLVKKWNSRIAEKDAGEITVDVFKDFSLMTIDAIMKCLMGVECNSQDEEGHHQDYVCTIHDISALITERMRAGNPLVRFDSFYNLTQNGRKFVKCAKSARKYAEDVINLRRKDYKDGVTIGAKLGSNSKNRRHFDFLDILFQARDSDGNGLTNEEISDEVNTFIFEGHDTTTSAISWACYCLASHPECQEKCHQEILDVVGDKCSADLDDLGQLKYVTMCVKESLRLYPPVASIARKPANDIEIDGMPIKKDTEIILSIIGVHYDSKNWPNPKQFDPLRFTAENVANRDPYAYVPFSAGMRNCIGQNFAMNEIKVCLVHVLLNFQLFADESNPPIPLIELIFRAKGGLHLCVKKRKNM